MQRFFRLSILAFILAIFGYNTGQADQVYVSGETESGHVRIFVKDSTYVIDRAYTVKGTLIIEPGTEVLFNPLGKLVVAAGGRVIADGFAEATYTQNPDNIDPVAAPGSSANPYGWAGYSDLDYFLYQSETSRTVSTIGVETARDITVHEDKYDYVYNVILDLDDRTIRDLEHPGAVMYPLDENEAVISFEQAIMFKAARMNKDINDDINLTINPWQRENYGTVPFGPERITFIGQPTNDFSREWGHIVVLPGARAAFFRNCSFEGFRKDTMVDRTDYYSQADFPGYTWDEVRDLNRRMVMASNGSGGAITTFSSRLWLLGCEFSNNTARYRGGALNILQAPAGFPMSDQAVGYYDADKNPNITDKDGNISCIVRNNPILKIDMIDEPGMEEPMSDYDRQAYDDGRLAVYLGRIRNLKFNQNKVELVNIIFTNQGGFQVVEQDYDNPADYPQLYGDCAYGGAIYIAGREGAEDRQIEVAFGLNNSIKIDGNIEVFDDEDTFHAIGNFAENYQDAASTKGARGGAIYLGRYTSMIVAGEFSHNKTYTKFLEDDASGQNSGYYSMGGAIFEENTLGRLQVRGGPTREDLNNQTKFYQNVAGAGGAIYVDGNTDPKMSPIIGGSDAGVQTRDYGFNIYFDENEALSWGGAVLTKRNMSINGAGGVAADNLIGYGGKYPVRFHENTAGYAGGALMVAIPADIEIKPPHERMIQIIRAEFNENVVGEGILDANKPEIRGGAAIYTINADLNVVKGVEFRENMLYNANGAAVCMVNPFATTKRFFLSDLDHVMYDENGVAYDFMSNDDVFTFEEVPYPADQRMLTRFLGNVIEVDDEILASQSGSGTTQIGKGTLVGTSNFYATTWLDNNTGYVVGYGGKIAKLTNGGVNWTYQTSGTNYRLNDVVFTSSDVGYAVGGVTGRPDAMGVILKTENGGSSWEELTTPIQKAVNDLFFIGTNTGYAVCDDGYILKTINGGATWTYTRPEDADLLGVFFTGVNRGYAVGERGLILVTDDGGATWDVQFIPSVIVKLNHIAFVDANVGYITGNAGLVVKTENGGQTWSVIDLGINDDLYSCFFTSQNTGYVTGTYGTLYKTEDGGDTWTELDAETDYNLYDVFFPTTSNGYIVGDAGLVKSTTDAGATWNDLRPVDESHTDVVRLHQEIMLPENGVGLGGALYILDSVTVNRIGRVDSVWFNRVRMQDNKSFSGAAIYSDNFDLKLILNRSLVAGNIAESEIGMEQNAITGPIVRDENTNDITTNFASSDLAGSIIYGEVQGPLPNAIYSEAANSIYDNDARFLIRLPDAPNTKGVLAGTTGIGYGGTDTLRGNYWGRTEANVDIVIENSFGYNGAIQHTFFVDTDGNNNLWLKYNSSSDLRDQGPFEKNGQYTYTAIPMKNISGNENTPEAGSIPDAVLQSGRIYDIYDKGTDIKTADYSKRRMSPIEDFAVGIPPIVKRFEDALMPSNGKYVKRYTRDPFVAEEIDSTGALKYPAIAQLQDEFRANKNGEMIHPIGYPLYLESMVDYDGVAERSNFDPRTLNESVFFVINETTGDFIRVNFNQVHNEAPYREIFRARVELVPDSTNRNPNSLIRRTAEGLINLGTGEYLLRQLANDPYSEDEATLEGRRYDNPYYSFGNVSDLFSNRDDNGNFAMPVDNNNQATFYAGERFTALPVDTGDVVRVISRTVLWREGVIPAYDDGISFKVVRNVDPPTFTGNVLKLRDDTASVTKIVPSEVPGKQLDTLVMTSLLNTIFLTENRYYPVEEGFYSDPDDPNIGDDAAGRDSILTITAMDTNQYYDPRSQMYPELYSFLTYEWHPTYDPTDPRHGQYNPNTALEHWILVDTVASENNTDWENSYQLPRDDADGYILFRGQPMNPFVVPGGEWINVKGMSYPPYYRTLDSLKALPDSLRPSDEYIAKFIELFRPYLSAPAYQDMEARYLQQDTIDYVGQNGYHTGDYAFRIIVVDSTPRFIGPDESEEEVTRRVDMAGTREVVGTYMPSLYPCRRSDEDGTLMANLTDKLRFKVDFNTDDELEDSWASGWDFRYGRTAYGFMNIAVRAGEDDVVIDSTIYDNDGDGRENDTTITQTRPVWMANEYLHEYGDGVTDPASDTFGAQFQTWGKLDIRIDRDEAIELLTPSKQVNNKLNTDTVFTVVVNDGHGGVNYMDMPVFINIQPEIITQSLPDAEEDIDYNPGLDDTTRAISVYDPNFGQWHEYELIYEDYPQDEIQKDPCFPEAGVWDVSNMKTTPDWLKINKESGLLYGKPMLKADNEVAPQDELVTVLVRDEDDLTYVKQIPLRVLKTNHDPDIDQAPIVKCIESAKFNADDRVYNDTLLVSDLDLLRRVDGENEVLTLTVVEPSAGVTLDPTTINGPLDLDTVKVSVTITDPSALSRDADGKVTIIIKVTDKDGAEKELPFRLKLMEEADFLCDIIIENHLGAMETLTWGTAARNASTGDADDGNPLGMLDSNYCEYDLPPLPPLDVFDARWTIPTRNGTLISVFPQAPGQEGTYVYRASFQAGGENGQTSPAYPVTLKWKKSQIPPMDNNEVNPSGGSWYLKDAQSNGNIFRVDMRDPNYNDPNIASYIELTEDGEYTVLSIKQNEIDAFLIIYDWTTPVETQVGLPTVAKVNSVSPNPYSNTGDVTVGFQIPRSGKIALDVFDALGNKVATLADSYYEAGTHNIVWKANDLDGKALSSGSYVVRLTANGTTSTMPLVIVK